MKNCNLCSKEHQEEVHSHIFTESLLRSGFNIGKSSKRTNKEVIYVVDEAGAKPEFVGQGVLPEEIREAGLVHVDLTVNNNPYINKDLVCRSCEKKMGPVESYFSSEIIPKIKSCNGKNLKLSYKECSVLKIFILLNLWRASVSRYDDFQFEKSLEESIGRFLKEVLGSGDEVPSIDEIIAKSDSLNSELLRSNNFVAVSSIPIEELTTNTLVAFLSNANPVIVLLNDFLFLFDSTGVNKGNLRVIENFLSKDLVKEIIEGESIGLQKLSPLVNNLMENQIKEKVAKVLAYFIHAWKIRFKNNPVESEQTSFVSV